MTTLAVGVIKDMYRNSSDYTKVDVQMRVYGLANSDHEADLVRYGVNPQLSPGAWDVLLQDMVKDWARDNMGYTFTASDDVRCINAGWQRTQGSASRSLNSAFLISARQDAFVNYSVDISCTLSLTGGQTGTAFLEIANDSGFTSGVQEVSRTLNANTGTLTIGLNITQSVTGQLSGYVPAGKYARIRTANTAGSPSFAYRSGQEALV